MRKTPIPDQYRVASYCRSCGLLVVSRKRSYGTLAHACVRCQHAPLLVADGEKSGRCLTNLLRLAQDHNVAGDPIYKAWPRAMTRCQQRTIQEERARTAQCARCVPSAPSRR